MCLVCLCSVCKFSVFLLFIQEGLKMSKFRVYLNYIQLCVYAFTGFIGALYQWAPKDSYENIQLIKWIYAPVTMNLLLMINPILGIFGERKERMGFYEAKFWLDLWQMLWWIIGISFYLFLFLPDYKSSFENVGMRFTGDDDIGWIVRPWKNSEKSLKLEYHLFIVFVTLTIIEFFLLVTSLITFCAQFQCRCCCGTCTGFCENEIVIDEYTTVYIANNEDEQHAEEDTSNYEASVKTLLL